MKKKFTLLTLLVLMASMTFAQRPFCKSRSQLFRMSTKLSAFQPNPQMQFGATVLPLKQAPANAMKERAANGRTKNMVKAKAASELVTPPSSATQESYVLNGEFYYLTNSNVFELDNIVSKCEGTVVVSGNDIYVQGICYWFADAWLKGTISEDKAVFATNQFIGEDEYGEEYIKGEDAEGNEADIVFDYDSTTGTLTLAEGSKINETDGSTTYFYWTGLVMTKGTLDHPDLLTPPAGLETEEWTLSSSVYGSNEKASYKVNVGFSGDEVYIQGLFDVLPESWVKGTVSGNTVTVADGQYLGYYSKAEVYLKGLNPENNYSVQDIVFTLNEDGNQLTTDNWCVLNGGADEINYFLIYTTPTLTLGEIAMPDLVTLPDGVESESWYVDGTFYVYSQGWIDATEYAASNVQVAFDGNDVYIKGLAYWFPNAWVKGTINGKTVTIPSGQYLGSDDIGAEYMVGSADGMTCSDIEFTLDSENSVLTSTTYIFECETPDELYAFTYWVPGLVLSKNAPEPEVVVTPPAGLETEAWTFTTQELSYDDNEDAVYTDVTFPVQVGFDGDQVYIQGLANGYVDEAWIVGTREGNEIVAATGQYMGDTDVYGETAPVYFLGYGATGVEDVVFTIDDEEKNITTDNYVIINGKKNTVYYYAIYTDVVITKGGDTPTADVDYSFDFNAMSEDTPTSNSGHDGDITEDLQIVEGDVTLTISPSDAQTPNRWWKEYNSGLIQLRVYGGTLTFEASGDKKIKKIVFNYGRWSEDNEADNGTLADNGTNRATWTGEAQKVVVSIAANTQLNSIVVTTEGEKVDGISTVTREADSESVFNLQGIRVSEAKQKGIYIRGGKKFVVK